MKVTVTQTISDLLEVRRIENKVSIMPFDVGLGAVLLSTVDAKGDLIVGTASDTVSRLPKGTDGYILLADSNEPTGLKWGAQQGGATFSMTNNDSVTHDVGTLVYLDTSGDLLVKRTTVAGDPKILAIAKESVPAGSPGVYAQTGKLTVLVQGNVAVGQWLIASSTAGRAQASSYAKPTSGAIGIAVTAYSGGGAGSVEALCDIDWRSVIPLQQLPTVSAPAYSNTSSYSFSHVVDSGTDCVVVLVGRKNNTAPTSVTLDGVTMTLHKTSAYSTYVTESVYYLKNPPIGTKTIVATFSNSAETTCTVLNFSGTQSTPLRTAVESAVNGGSVSLTPSSAVGDIVLFFTTSGETNWTGNSSGMVVIDSHLTGTGYTQRSWYKPGESGTTTVSATGSSAYFTSIGVAVAGS